MSQVLSPKEVERIKTMYPKGTRIQIERMNDRIDEYETERKIKRAKITKIAASVTPVCAAAVVGVGLWKGGILTTEHDQFIVSNVETTVSDAEQIITENSDASNNIVENVTNTTSSEKVNSTTKETENINSDSPVVVIPETL